MIANIGEDQRFMLQHSIVYTSEAQIVIELIVQDPRLNCHRKKINGQQKSADKRFTIVQIND